jgi:hypothetical protein
MNRMLWDKRHCTQGYFEDVVPSEQDKISLTKAVNPLNNPFLLFFILFHPINLWQKNIPMILYGKGLNDKYL